MKTATVLLLALVLALPVMANDIKVPNDTDVILDRMECDVANCDYYSMTVNAEFDDVDALLVFGPLATTGDCVIGNVVLEIDINQTWCGDLQLHLYYDADGDGVYDAGPVSALCRPDLDGCPMDGCCGCSGDVIGVYTFGDDADETLGEPNCPTVIPPGCYLPSIETPEGFIDTFGGFLAGGDFYIEVADCAGGDSTILTSWGVYVCCAVTPAGQNTWSQIKSVY